MKLGTLKQRALGLFVSCLIGFCGSVQAIDCCNPCNNSWMDKCGGFTVGADFLLWKACVNDLDYGLVFDGDPSATFPPSINGAPVPGSYQYVGPGWEPGVRVRIGKDNIWCGADVVASYTWYQAKTGHVSPVGDGQFGYDSLFHGGFNDLTDLDSLEGKYGIRYQSFDVLVGYNWYINPCSVIHPFFGVEGLKLRQDINTKSTSNQQPDAFQSVAWNSDYRAIGLKAGTDYHYTICDGLSLFSLVSISLLAGKNDQVNRQNLTLDDESPESYIEYTSNDCFCMPGLHLQVGVEYAKCFCGTEFSFRLGYEFLDWWNTARPRRFFDPGDDIAIATPVAGSNITLHGLFVGFDVGF
jgi:hypothetical protein